MTGDELVPADQADVVPVDALAGSDSRASREAAELEQLQPANEQGVVRGRAMCARCGGELGPGSWWSSGLEARVYCGRGVCARPRRRT